MINNKRIEVKYYVLIVIYIYLYLSITKEHLIIENMYYSILAVGTLVSVSSLIVVCLTTHTKKENFYKYLALHFASISISNILWIELNRMSYVNSTNVNMIYFLDSFTQILEITSILLSFKYLSKKVKLRKEIVIRSTVLLFVIALIFKLDNLEVYLFYREGDTTLLRKGSQIIFICVFIYLTKYMTYYKSKIPKNVFKDLRIYLVLKIVSISYVFINEAIIYNVEVASTRSNIEFMLYVFLSLIKSITIYQVSKICLIQVIKRPNDELYENLQDEKERLKQKVLELENAKTIIEKNSRTERIILENLQQGILMYSYNKIIFVNKTIGEYFKLSDTSRLIGINIKDLICERCTLERNNTVNNILGMFENTQNIVNGDCFFEYNNVQFTAKLTIINNIANDDNVKIVIVRNMDKEKQVIELERIIEEKRLMEKAKRDLLSNISHEFKTPVNVIYSTAQVQDLNISKEKYGELRKYNEIVKQNCNRLIRLINNFIDSSKFESKEFSLEPKTVNIVELVEEITLSVITYAQDREISIIFDTSTEESYCTVDIELIERIILNLLSNSIKYNKKNGEVNVVLDEDKKSIYIKIKDTGIGIPKDKLDKMFNRFDRIDRKEIRHKEGTGIGLNIVKQMVGHINGNIEIESEENIGTTVTLSIPKEKEIKSIESLCIDSLGSKVELELSDI